MAASPIPRAIDPMPMRPPASSATAMRKPSLMVPSRFSPGTRQFSRISSLVGEASWPSFFSSLPTQKPGNEGSTRKALMPLPLRAVLSVTAQITNRSANSALVMKILRPLKSQSFPSATALMRMAAGSEPALVSVRPKLPATYSPLQRGGIYFSFWYSLPTAWMTSATMLVTEVVTAVEAQPRPSSVMTREKATAPAPVPPYSGATLRPMNPSSASFFRILLSLSRSLVRSSSAAMGSNS